MVRNSQMHQRRYQVQKQFSIEQKIRQRIICGSGYTHFLPQSSLMGIAYEIRKQD